MKIISKFKDYYDGACFNYDSEFVYVRNQETKEVKIDKNKTEIPFYSYRPNPYLTNKNLYVFFGVIGFCGELFPVVYIRDYRYNIMEPYQEPPCFLYSFDEFESYVSENKISLRDNILSSDKKTVKTFFETKNDLSLFNRYFEQFSIPIFYTDFKHDRDEKSPNLIDLEIYTNICLKTFSFYKRKNFNEVAQELSMFLGNVITKKEKEIKDVPDKYKIEQHGFDPKYGFRKPPKNKK